MAKANEAVPVEEFLVSRWLPAIRPTIRNSTHYGYRGAVDNHIVPHFAGDSLRDVIPERLNGFYAGLLVDGSTRWARPLAPRSVIRVHATIHRALRDAVRWGYLRENPADKADPPRQTMQNFELRTWGLPELRRFLEATSRAADPMLWLLLAMTGMRRGEVLGLRWKDVDIEKGVLAVRQTVIQVGRSRELSTPKTSRGRRLVALDVATLHQIARFSEERAGGPDELLFVDRDGGLLSGPMITQRFKRIVKDADLPAIRLHDLRHTHATLALQAGVHPKIVSERLGHSTVAFTLDVYSHATPHMQTEAAELIGTLVAGDRVR